MLSLIPTQWNQLSTIRWNEWSTLSFKKGAAFCKLSFCRLLHSYFFRKHSSSPLQSFEDCTVSRIQLGFLPTCEALQGFTPTQKWHRHFCRQQTSFAALRSALKRTASLIKIEKQHSPSFLLIHIVDSTFHQPQAGPPLSPERETCCMLSFCTPFPSCPFNIYENTFHFTPAICKDCTVSRIRQDSC